MSTYGSRLALTLQVMVLLLVGLVIGLVGSGQDYYSIQASVTQAATSYEFDQNAESWFNEWVRLYIATYGMTIIQIILFTWGQEIFLQFFAELNTLTDKISKTIALYSGDQQLADEFEQHAAVSIQAYQQRWYIRLLMFAGLLVIYFFSYTNFQDTLMETWQGYTGDNWELALSLGLQIPVKGTTMWILCQVCEFILIYTGRLAVHIIIHAVAAWKSGARPEAARPEATREQSEIDSYDLKETLVWLDWTENPSLRSDLLHRLREIGKKNPKVQEILDKISSSSSNPAKRTELWKQLKQLAET